MDTHAVHATQLFLGKDFEQIAESRAEKHQHLRERNNVTSCRSPTREHGASVIKNELKEKRQLEFMRRRSFSPDLCGLKSAGQSSKRRRSPKTPLVKYSSSQMLHANIPNTPSGNQHPAVTSPPNTCVTDEPSGSKWVAFWSEEATLTRTEKNHAKKQASTAIQVEPKQHGPKSTDTRGKCVNGQMSKLNSFIQAAKTEIFSVQTESTFRKNTCREVAVQTEFGFIAVKESDIQQLADCLQEALWREEAVKKKLAALQESVSNLINSSNNIWTARCSEDLLRNKINALEAQLQVCLQKFSKDGVKKLAVQMEKQKLMYEEKALVALQKATQEKMEALSKAETLQEALICAQAETLRWQSLYEEQKMTTGQLKKNQNISLEQLQQLHSQMEMTQARGAELREALSSLKQEKKALQYTIFLLEEDNQILRDQIQNFRDGSKESEDFVVEDTQTQLTMQKDSQVEEQLRNTQEKLQLKERECEELQMELHAMEQECQSTQVRLSQCREELRQRSHPRSKPTLCGSWWRVVVLFLLLIALAGAAMLWLWHPPFREQVEDLYADIEKRVKDYLLTMACPQHSGCFRPI
ncbi:TRAF3-interacting JNK-activating modulator isoform X2 [Thalassophryne amazonica]|uniref:TRAF3-interacting JNK-activating modulator isoform X2 n=1 Tax=Thalassophryne amazonica TaxID=390379 RepID=UPI001471F75A|nr:TRAF3-interacting JNK-activating modulator isoform X2 [Thalassophryne amazonica]